MTQTIVRPAARPAIGILVEVARSIGIAHRGKGSISDGKSGSTPMPIRYSRPITHNRNRKQVDVMIIVLQVNAPLHMAQGIKEALAMQLEKYGDTRVLEIRTEETAMQEAMKI